MKRSGTLNGQGRSETVNGKERSYCTRSRSETFTVRSRSKYERITVFIRDEKNTDIITEIKGLVLSLYRPKKVA
jgi:hypothetical protein